jgi:hypothetical protein
MIWVILFAVVSFVIGWKGFRGDGDGWGEACTWAAFMAVIAGGIGLLVSAYISPVLPYKWVETKSTVLVSLRSGDGIEGQFFLGSGSINAVPYYFFYKEVGEGFQLDKVKVDNALIFEGNQQGGLLKTYHHEFAKKWHIWLAFPCELKAISHVKYEFYIPVGSIRRGFDLR